MLATHLARLLRDERGATAIEYTFIAALISMMVVAGATQIGGSVKGFFESVSRGFS